MGIPNLVIGICVVLLTLNGLVHRRWLGTLITLAVNTLARIGIFLTMPVSLLVTPWTSGFILLGCLLFNLFIGRYLTDRKDAWRGPAGLDILW